MEINSFIRDCIGYDDQGKPVVLVDAALMLYDAKKDRLRDVIVRTMETPSFNLVKKGDFAEISIIFKTDKEIDMRVLEKILIDTEKYIVPDDDNAPFPLCDITIIPKKYMGKFFLQCRNPLTWGLQPHPQTNMLSVIKLLYPLEAITLLEAPEEEYVEIEKEVDAELNELEREEKELMAEEARLMAEEDDDSGIDGADIIQDSLNKITD